MTNEAEVPEHVLLRFRLGRLEIGDPQFADDNHVYVRKELYDTKDARIAELKAKLAKAVDVDLIEQCIRDVLDEGGSIRSAAEYVARATLAEMKGTD